MTDLSSLIERLEKATGPNYALEVDIFKFFNPEYSDYIKGRGGLVHRNDGEDQRVLSNVRPPNVTASIDAAVALAERVLPNWQINLSIFHDTLAEASFGNREAPHARSQAPKPALAICLATLRALQSKGPGA